MSIRYLRVVLLLVMAMLAVGPAYGQAYPNHPIKLLVPFAAGGAVDVTARLLGSKMTDQLGQPIVIENRPGAGGTLAVDVVAKAAPDGYTILQNTNGAAIAPALYNSLPFDALKDLVPITQITISTLVLVASPTTDLHGVQDLIARAKAKPGALNYGSSGVGNALHLTMEMFKHQAGIDMLAVPFRGDAQINAAVIAGDVQVAMVPIATAVPLINDGRIRALGVTSARRSPALPQVPTLIEQGMTGFTAYGWQGWFAPAGTPAPIVDRIQRELAKVLTLPDIQERIKAMGNELVGSTPAEFDAFYKAEIAKFAKVIEDAKIPKQ
jgi:tripartite-type tricarboxylate transporter receptor subunit TctC